MTNAAIVHKQPGDVVELASWYRPAVLTVHPAIRGPGYTLADAYGLLQLGLPIAGFRDI